MYRLLVLGLCFFLAACQGVLVHEIRSDYSHIRIVDYGTRRALLFAGESGSNVVETMIDLAESHRLQHPYASAMMAGFLYRPEASSALLVGLGGGALVRFLNHHFPGLQLDIVEIDPVVVRVARDFFGTVEGPRTRIFVADARDYLSRTTHRYDLIWLDAHLHPSALTDNTGQPLSLKTAAFFQSLHERLHPDGVALFNVIDGRDASAYISSIRAAFAATEVFRPPSSGNVIVVARTNAPQPGDDELRARALALDSRVDYGFSFERLLDMRERGAKYR